MLIFKDILTGDEMISDSFGLKEVHDVFYEVDAKKITIGGDNIDIGANPSAEGGGDEGVEDGSQVVIDVVHSFRLQQTSFDKKSYMTYLKGYMKRIQAKIQEEGGDPKEFEKAVKALGTKLTDMVKAEPEYYIGESMDPEGMVALLNWREDGITPYFTFWKHGLKGEKV